MSHRLRRFLSAKGRRGLLLLAMAPVGCGPSVGPNGLPTDMALVKGTVTLAKRPLPSGTLVLAGANGWRGRAQIRPNGSYVIRGVPIGEVKIGVEPSPTAKMKVNRLKHVPIPPRYEDPQTSGLTFTVTAGGGEQEQNIELTP